MSIKYQVFVTLKKPQRYGKKYTEKSVFNGVSKKINSFDTKEEAIDEAKAYWKDEINKLYIRKVMYYPMEEIEAND